MKKVSKKICSIVLALALCMSLCCTAFAASSPETPGSITINGAIANETYTIYQIFDLTYTDYEEGETPESYSYKVVDAWQSFVESYTFTVTTGEGDDQTTTGYTLFTLTDYNYLSPDSLIFTYQDEGTVVTDDVIATFAREALSYASDEKISGVSAYFAWDEEEDEYVVHSDYANVSIGATYTDENGYVYADMTFSGLSLGYYLVDTSLGSLCMLDSTDPDATVNEKNSTPTLSKYVYNHEYSDYEGSEHQNNNNTVTYELEVDHITGAMNLVVHDSQPREIEDDWTDFHPTVSLVDGESTITLTENEDYVIKLTGAVSDNNEDCSDSDFNTEEHPCTFEIDFTNYDFSNVSDAAYIEIIYSGLLAENGDSFDDDEDEIDNFAVVTFGASSSSPVVEAEVYSFGFEIFKYTGDLDGEETEYGTYYVFQDTITHDGPADIDNDFVFVATDGNYEYYAQMDVLTNVENSYLITGWTDDEDEATTITEPQDETTFTIYVTENSMQELAALENESSVASLLEDAQFHLVEIGGSETELQDEDALEYEIEYGTVPGTASPLANATFEVTNENNQTAYFLYEAAQNIYLFEGWLDVDDEVPNGYTSSVTSGEDGMVYIEGLDTGTYYVNEIAAPDGFNRLDSTIIVTITATYKEDGTIDTWTVSYGYGDTEGTGTVNVLNNTGDKLPSTGGIGTTIFYIIGGILVVGAVVVLVTRRRMTSES